MKHYVCIISENSIINENRNKWYTNIYKVIYQIKIMLYYKNKI